MTHLRTRTENVMIVVAIALVFGWSWGQAPEWYGMIRTVMMITGGLVVLVLVLVVSIAIISGVMGMAGRLKKKS